jgi:hypothetical protein
VEGATAEIDRQVDQDGSARGAAPHPGAGAPRGGSQQRRLRRARTARVVVALVVLAAGLAAVTVAHADRDAARDRAAAMAAEGTGAAAARAEVEAREQATLEAQAEADLLRSVAGEAREEQRERLLALGLTEFTVDRFLDRVRGNTEHVEWERDGETALVDRQAQEIPELERCLVAARQAVNSAFNLSIDPSVAVPTPTDLCRALLAPT